MEHELNVDESVNEYCEINTSKESTFYNNIAVDTNGKRVPLPRGIYEKVFSPFYHAYQIPSRIPRLISNPMINDIPIETVNTEASYNPFLLNTTSISHVNETNLNTNQYTEQRPQIVPFVMQIPEIDNNSEVNLVDEIPWEWYIENHINISCLFATVMFCYVTNGITYDTIAYTCCFFIIFILRMRSEYLSFKYIQHMFFCGSMVNIVIILMMTETNNICSISNLIYQIGTFMALIGCQTVIYMFYSFILVICDLFNINCVKHGLKTKRLIYFALILAFLLIRGALEYYRGSFWFFPLYTILIVIIMINNHFVLTYIYGYTQKTHRYTVFTAIVSIVLSFLSGINIFYPIVCHSG